MLALVSTVSHCCTRLAVGPWHLLAFVRCLRGKPGYVPGFNWTSNFCHRFNYRTCNLPGARLPVPPVRPQIDLSDDRCVIMMLSDGEWEASMTPIEVENADTGAAEVLTLSEQEFRNLVGLVGMAEGDGEEAGKGQ